MTTRLLSSKPSRKQNVSSAYVLKITLEGTRPAIWRRVLVPGDATLGWLHAVLQLAMGWTNSHLHVFRAGDRIYSDPQFQLQESGDGLEMFSENKISLEEVLPQPNSKLEYEYDFGDSWHHTILAEEILPPGDAPIKAAKCLGGERACPPEDCGGPPGFENLRQIMRKPSHREHAAMRQWLGRRFEEEEFDPATVNLWLQKLKWPRPTEAQLRQLLVSRDRAAAVRNKARS
jgi:hypothetical protein